MHYDGVESVVINKVMVPLCAIAIAYRFLVAGIL